jgi:D-amino-acid dehydrogenase
VVFKFNTSVKRLRLEGARIAGIITDQGPLDADSYVVALGSAAARLLRPLGIDLPIYPVKGYSVTIDIDTNVPAPRSSVMDEHYKVMITRLGTRLRAAGIAELSGYDVSIRPSGPATVLRSLRELFPQAAIAREAGALNAWAGLRPMTPDGPPYLGATGIANLYVNVGQGIERLDAGLRLRAVGGRHRLRPPTGDRSGRIQHRSLARRCELRAHG